MLKAQLDCQDDKPTKSKYPFTTSVDFSNKTVLG